MNNYINKSYRSFEKLSRYESFPYYFDTESQKYVYGRTAFLDQSTAFTIHVTGPDDTFDSLALFYYGNPTYYWIIADFNRVLDCYTTLPENINVMIPSISSIRFDV